MKLNVAHYSWGALMINQYGHGSAAGFGECAAARPGSRAWWRARLPPRPFHSRCCPRACHVGGMGVLSYFGLAEADAWSYLAIAVAFFFGWSVLAWLALAFMYSHKR